MVHQSPIFHISAWRTLLLFYKYFVVVVVVFCARDVYIYFFLQNKVVQWPGPHASEVFVYATAKLIRTNYVFALIGLAVVPSRQSRKRSTSPPSA